MELILAIETAYGLRLTGQHRGLAARVGLSQTTLAEIETDRAALDMERAKSLGRALQCHPGVLAFPGWDIAQESAALRHELPTTIHSGGAA